MSTVVVFLPATNEAGAGTLPETTKLSVPSTKESSMISTEAFWVLPVVAPWSNITSFASRRKSSRSTRWWKRATIQVNLKFNNVNYHGHLSIENATAFSDSYSVKALHVTSLAFKLVNRLHHRKVVMWQVTHELYL